MDDSQNNQVSASSSPVSGDNNLVTSNQSQVSNDSPVVPQPLPETNQPTNLAQPKADEPPSMMSPLDQTDQLVNDIVAQGTAIQDLFAQNDVQSLDVSAQTSVTTPQPLSPSNTPTTNDSTNQPQPKTDEPLAQPDQRSPLDILEEILSKEEKKAAEVENQGPTPEDLEKIRQQEEAEKNLIEEQRKKMLAETQTAEQQHRDQIRQQQVNVNKVVNPHEIRQLERKKFS